MKRVAAFLIVLLFGNVLCIPTLHAMQIIQLHTEYHDGEYRLMMIATLTAPIERVQMVLRDYERYPELDERILQARILNRPQVKQLQLLTRIKVCFAFLCRTVQRVERVEEQDNLLQAQVLPEQSEGERGTTRTQLSTGESQLAAGQTQVSYETRIVPKFWVPAWVGRAWMLRSMQEATVSLFTRIEQRAGQTP